MDFHACGLVIVECCLQEVNLKGLLQSPVSAGPERGGGEEGERSSPLQPSVSAASVRSPSAHRGPQSCRAS